MRAIAIVASVCAGLVLSGCAPSDPGGSSAPPDPTVTSPSETPPVADTTAPTPRLDIDCDGLLPAALVADTVAPGLTHAPVSANPSYATPQAYAVQQLGGWACAATNGVVTPVGGSVPTAQAVIVWVMPEADAQYAVYSGMYPGVVTGSGSTYGDSSNVTCFGRGADSSCTANILSDGFWIDIVMTGIAVDAAVDDAGVTAHVAPLISSIVAPFAAGTALSPAWVPPADTLALPADCTGLATAEEVRSNLGYTAELAIDQPDGPRGGWGLNSAAAQDADVVRCLWMVAGSDESVGGLSALPGGAWAFDASFALTSAAGREHAVTAPIAGVERASFGCQMEFGETCRLNMVVGGNWLQMVAGLNPGGDEAVLEAQMAAFAAIIAARIV